MSNKIQISIVIPTFNRCDDLCNCLLSLKKEANCQIETIVIDDCSTDSTVQMIREQFPDVRLFQNKMNLGPSYARNIGVREANGEYVLFLDSDTSFQRPDIFDKFIVFFKEHKDAGSVGGEINVYGNRNRVLGRMISINGDSRPFAIFNETGNYEVCDFLATCCCMVRKDVIQNIGGFDPYYGFGGEDKDFGYRIKEAGYKNFISADCAVEHYHSPSGRSDNETYKYHNTRMRFVLKCFSKNKIIIAFMCWISSIIFFYMKLPVKLILLKLKGIYLTKENLCGGLYIAKALYENIRLYKKIKLQCSKNHLEPYEMKQYVSSCKKEEQQCHI